MRTFTSLLPALVAAAIVAAPAVADDHLLLTEAVVTPTSDEYLEIANPTAGTIALDDYYLSDDDDYALLPGQFGAGPAPAIGSSDFIIRFPPGATIDAGEVLVIAFDGAGFAATFGFAADYEVRATDPSTPDMIEAYLGSLGATAGLTNSGENAVLFFWDGASDLVADVDMLNIGTPSVANAIADKSLVAVDGPDADLIATNYLADAYTMPQQASDPGFGFSTKRIALEAGFETQAGGNGVTGHDETTEVITSTWDSVFSAPDPGVSNAVNPPMGVVLSVAKEGPPLAIAGSEITYTITLENIGSDPAANVSVVDTLPAGFSFISETHSQGVLVDNTDPTIGWDLGTVAAGGSATLTLTVEVNDALSGDFTNMVDITTSSPGDDPADNHDEFTTNVSQIVVPPTDLFINEIRINMPQLNDPYEYFELLGAPNTDLSGLAYVVIGDGAVAQGSGVIEEVISLNGLSTDAAGLFTAGPSTIGPLVSIFLIDLLVDPNFEDGDNVTHLLVANFTGVPFDDLDTNDDGVLDVTPWTHVLDAVGLIEEPNPPLLTEYAYGAALGGVDVGPDATFVPAHVFRCVPDDTWEIGTFDAFDPANADTPTLPNDPCPTPPCPQDTDGDGDVDGTDLVNVILDWGTNGAANNGDVDGSGIVDGTDLVAVILAWGLCP